MMRAEKNKDCKIVLIGPVYPYKGGIAHYTALLYRALEKKYAVEMISYKMQYPRFMFRKEQKDFNNDMFRVEDTKFWIHTANPFNIIRVGRIIKKKKPDIVLIQWWHPYFSPCFCLLCKALGKETRKVFTCHNVFPHERFPLDKLLTKLALKNGDAFIVHSKSDGADLMSIKPDALYRFSPHPTVNAFREGEYTKEQARKELDIRPEKKILLFFGFVKEYKGLKHLVKAMPEIRKRLPEVELMVVGSFDHGKEEYEKLIRKEGIEDAVKLVDGYIPDHEVEKYFMASDLVVLPYESATQSGILQIAFGFEKPVIVTNVGGLPDVVQDGKTGYIVEPGDPKGIAEAVIHFFQETKEGEFVRHIKEEASRFEWGRMTECVEDLREEMAIKK